MSLLTLQTSSIQTVGRSLALEAAIAACFAMYGRISQGIGSSWHQVYCSDKLCSGEASSNSRVWIYTNKENLRFSVDLLPAKGLVEEVFSVLKILDGTSC